jgi:hypothetical protein
LFSSSKILSIVFLFFWCGSVYLSVCLSVCGVEVANLGIFLLCLTEFLALVVCRRTQMLLGLLRFLSQVGNSFALHCGYELRGVFASSFG